MTCSYFYFTTCFSLLTFERKLLLSTDDLCTLNSVLILHTPLHLSLPHTLTQDRNVSCSRKEFWAQKPVFHGNMFC